MVAQMDIQRPGEWPLLVRIKIFSFLDMNDLMRCSRLSNAWRSLILDSVEISSLSCKEKVGQFHELRYSFNFETIENDRLLLADDLKFLRSESLLTVLRRSLKKLYIHHPLGYIEQSSKSLVSALNQLIQLEQLQLNELEFVGNTEELILPNLQCLTIPKVTRYGQLTLNTPKLTSFSTGDICMQNSGKLRNFKFEYPANIVCLDVEEYEPDLMKFPNLEILYCQTFSNKLASIHDLLVALPKLKQLQCQNVHGESVCQLLSSKCKLRRLDFNFYFCGFRIDTINDLDEYMNWKHDQFEIEWAVYGYKSMLSNPHKLSQHIRYVWEIYYYEVLVQSFDRISFASFFGRIAKMEDVEINGPVNDEPKLVEFLKACKFITNLSTEKTALSQSLFDRLPVYQPYIYHLHLDEEIELDLQFVLKFEYLRSFSTNQKVSLHFISRAFRELKLLDCFNVGPDDNWFRIERKSICNFRGNKQNTFEFTGEASMFAVLEDFFECLA